MARVTNTGFLFLFAMTVIGLFIYLRLWSVESDLDLNNNKVDRLIFEQAQSEALEEAAEWRKKFDEESENSRTYQERLYETKQTLEKKKQRLENLETRLKELQKENHKLLMEQTRLKQELGNEKLKCENLKAKAV